MNRLICSLALVLAGCHLIQPKAPTSLLEAPRHRVAPERAVPVVLVVPEDAGEQAPDDRYRFRILAGSCFESRLGQVWEYDGADQVAEYEALRSRQNGGERPRILSADLLAIADFETDRHRTVVHVRLFDLTRNFGDPTPNLWLGRVLLFEEAVVVEREPGAAAPPPQQLFDEFTKAFAEIDQRLTTDPRLQRFMASAAAKRGKVERELLGLPPLEAKPAEETGELILFPFAATIRAAADQRSVPSPTPATPPSKPAVAPPSDHPKADEAPASPAIERQPSTPAPDGSS